MNGVEVAGADEGAESKMPKTGSPKEGVGARIISDMDKSYGASFSVRFLIFSNLSRRLTGTIGGGGGSGTGSCDAAADLGFFFLTFVSPVEEARSESSLRFLTASMDFAAGTGLSAS